MPQTDTMSTPARLSHSDTIQQVLIQGDLSRLTQTQQLEYYKTVCQTLKLNPFTKPFAFIKLNGQLRLYALKDCTEQLRKLHNVSLEIKSSEIIKDVYQVSVKCSMGDRTDGATGAVFVGNLKGEALANAFMKAETKAKRRATLSICGLGMLDEAEVDSTPLQKPVMAGPALVDTHLSPNSSDRSSIPPKQDHPTHSGYSLTQKQLKRLFAISKQNGWSNDAVAQILQSKFGVESSSDLSREQYDEMCDQILPNPPKQTPLSAVDDVDEFENFK